jgi:hypothetical protein
MVVKIQVDWAVMLCSVVAGYQRFRLIVPPSSG